MRNQQIHGKNEDNKAIARIRNSKKDKTTNNSRQNSTHKKDFAARTILKTGGKIRCSLSVGNSCSTCGTHRVKNLMKSHERGKVRIVITTNGTF